MGLSTTENFHSLSLPEDIAVSRPPAKDRVRLYVKVTILTLGCRVNQSESSLIEGSLKEQGFSIVSLSEKPDYCIINSCTVTAKSDYQSRQVIRRAVRSGAQVIVTGCYSQLNPGDISKIDSSIRVVHNADKLHDINAIFNIISSSTISYSSRSEAPRQGAGWMQLFLFILCCSPCPWEIQKCNAP